MKKHWQIKPWFFLLILVILGGSLVYIFFDNQNIYLPKYWGMNTSVQTDGAAYAPMMDMDDSAMDYALERAYEEEAIGYGEGSGNIELDSRLIIKNASLSMVVDDVRESISKITQYIEDNDGFLVNSNVNKYDINLRGELTVRVPAQLLDETISYVKGMGEVEEEYIEGRDITEEYVDLEAQLGNLKATETQLLEIMEDAKEVEDVLNVQRELSNVRNNIERIEARIRYLSESVDLSKLTIYLSTDPENLPIIEEKDQWKPFAVLKAALRSLLDTAVAILNGLIWLAVYLPVFLLILAIIWSIRKHLRSKRKK